MLGLGKGAVALLFLAATGTNALATAWSHFLGWTYGEYMSNPGGPGTPNLRLKGRLGTLPFVVIRTKEKIAYRLYGPDKSPILRIDYEAGRITSTNANGQPVVLADRIKSQFLSEMLIVSNAIADYTPVAHRTVNELEEYDVEPEGLPAITVAIKASGQCSKIVVRDLDRIVVYVPAKLVEFGPGKKLYSVWERDKEPPIYIDFIQAGDPIYDGE